jgi:ubiquinone/menaquinone biosynthesis C-methylase UbiE
MSLPPSTQKVASYDYLPAAERYLHRTRDEALLAMLGRRGITSLSGRRILELGCGQGSLLRSLMAYGAAARDLTGIDPAFERIRRARSASGAGVAVADGALLPFENNSFELVFIFTALSSMRDIDVRRHAAHEALRVVMPGGLVIVYDFWTNPLNANVRPVSMAEMQHIFDPHTLEVERVTLAPPVVRLLRGNETICRALDRRLLRTHLLAVVAKEGLDG